MTHTRLLIRQLVGIALLALAGMAPATAQTDPRLVGSWEVLRVLDANGEDATKPNEGAVMTFHADGALLVQFTDGKGTTVGDEIRSTYRVDGNALVVQDTDGTERSVLYRFEGDELVLMPEAATKQVAYLRRTEASQ